MSERRITVKSYERRAQATTEKRCKHCHELFAGMRLQDYCSRVCQNAAHYRRNRPRSTE